MYLGIIEKGCVLRVKVTFLVMFNLLLLQRINISWASSFYFFFNSFYISGLPADREWSKSKRFSSNVTPVNGQVGRFISSIRLQVV